MRNTLSIIWAIACHSSTDSASVLFLWRTFSIFPRIDNCCFTQLTISEVAEEDSIMVSSGIISSARRLSFSFSVTWRWFKWWKPLWKNMLIFSCFDVSKVFPLVCSNALLSWCVTFRYKKIDHSLKVLYYACVTILSMEEFLTRFSKGKVVDGRAGGRTDGCQKGTLLYRYSLFSFQDTRKLMFCWSIWHISEICIILRFWIFI